MQCLISRGDKRWLILTVTITITVEGSTSYHYYYLNKWKVKMEEIVGLVTDNLMVKTHWSEAASSLA